MASPTLKLPTARQGVVYALLAVVSFVVFVAFNRWLWGQGFVAEEAAFFGEKLRLAYEGVPPRLIHVAFIAPVFPYTLAFLFKDPLIANAFVGAVSVVVFAYVMTTLWRQKKLATSLYALVMGYVALSPVCWYVVTQRSDLCLFFVLFFLSLHHLHRYFCAGHPLSLLWYGATVGGLFYATGETLLLAALMVPALLFTARERALPRVAMLLIAFFPVVFLISVSTVLGVCYSPMVGVGDLFSPMLMPWSDHLLTVSSRGNIVSTVALALAEMGRCFLFVGPFILCAFLFGRKASAVSRVFVVLPLYVVVRIFVGTYDPDAAFYLAFVVFAFLVLGGAYGKLAMARWQQVAAVGVVVVSWVAGLFLFYTSPDVQERAFSRVVVGAPSKGNLDTSRRLAEVLGETEGVVLLDDQEHYKLVYLSEDIGRFILPYQHDFELALSVPSYFADFVVVSKKGKRDTVLKRYPDTVNGKLQGYRVFASTEDITVFVKKDNA